MPLSLQSRGEDAMQAAIAAVGLVAYQSTHRALKARARKYMREPMHLEWIYPDLSLADATQTEAIADHLLEQRMIRGFTHHALRIIARWKRRFEHATLPAEYAAEARRDAVMETAS
jgi:hypothetical protein